MTGDLLSQIRKQIEIANRYDLIEPEDKFLVAISGGKDSLTLLDCLFQMGYNSMTSIHISISKDDRIPYTDFCEKRSDFKILSSDILAEVKSNKRKNACYICSRLKRQMLFRYTLENGFNKIAFAHHQDDVIETFLLNLLFQRELSTMLPKQELFKGKIFVVRPLYFTPESIIKSYAQAHSLPISDYSCNYESSSRRAWVKEQIRLWQKNYPKINIRSNLMKSILHPNPNFLPTQQK